MTETWQTIQFPSSESAIALAGHQEANLKLIARQTGANLVLRGLELRIAGQPTPVERATAIVRSLSILWQEAKLIAEADIMTAIHALDTGRSSEYKELQQDILARTRRGELIRAKTFRQRQYIQAIQSHDITFCIGPAGTGKTFLAAVLAVQALLEDSRTDYPHPAGRGSRGKIRFSPRGFTAKSRSFFASPLRCFIRIYRSGQNSRPDGTG
jgi:phosphate starvation-inducible PhoH-like protein